MFLQEARRFCRRICDTRDCRYFKNEFVDTVMTESHQTMRRPKMQSLLHNINHRRICNGWFACGVVNWLPRLLMDMDWPVREPVGSQTGWNIYSSMYNELDTRDLQRKALAFTRVGKLLSALWTAKNRGHKVLVLAELWVIDRWGTAGLGCAFRIRTWSVHLSLP
jgi:hypothetical protein